MNKIDDNTAKGQSDPEYVTVILRLCGVEEEWTPGGVLGHWRSSHRELRDQLEQLVALIKKRTVSNVLAHQEMKEAVDAFPAILDRWKKGK